MNNFADLTNLCKFLPQVEPIHLTEKSEVVPMKVLVKDKKLK